MYNFFAISCNHSSHVRIGLVSIYNTVSKTCCNFNNLSSENKMIYLLTCEDEETVKDVGNFIKECIIR